MLLLAGLGNPGEKYARHRHNVGFMAVDAIAERHAFGAPRGKFQSEMREGRLDGDGPSIKALALKPQTYMNESGRAVGEALRFYKLGPEDLVVFHDELDLAPGKLRVRTGGGHAGHNGLRSIAAHIGADFRRVRIGIGHPGDKSKVTGHVLGDFAKADADWLEPLLRALAAAAPRLADGDAAYQDAINAVAQAERKAAERAARPELARDAAPRRPPTEKSAAPGGAMAEALKKLTRREP